LQARRSTIQSKRDLLPTAFEAVFGKPGGKVKVLDSRKFEASKFWDALGFEVSGSTRYGSLPAREILLCDTTRRQRNSQSVEAMDAERV